MEEKKTKTERLDCLVENGAASTELDLPFYQRTPLLLFMVPVGE